MNGCAFNCALNYNKYHVYIVWHVIVICSVHLWEPIFNAFNGENKLSESAIAVLSVSPHPPSLRSLTTPTFVAFFKTVVKTDCVYMDPFCFDRNEFILIDES